MDIEKIKTQRTIKELLDFSIINIDKPSNPTSFGVDTIIKKELCLTKTSHFGTLDPRVTGVLPISLNRACRLMSHFTGKNKTYIGVMRIHKDIPLKELNQKIKPFIGEISQLPPIKSRVKREQRQRTIHSFKILEKSEKDILFETEVQAGTYIRKLIHDIGKKIGGAHMLELRRTKASIFEEKNSIKIPEFIKAVEEYKKGNETPLRQTLIPAEIISQVLKPIQVKKGINKLYHGSPLYKEFLEKQIKLPKDEKIAVFDKNKFIGIYKITNEKEILARPEFTLQPIKNENK